MGMLASQLFDGEPVLARLALRGATDAISTFSGRPSLQKVHWQRSSYR
jgi:hypothetical protein